ncbi:MAG TPA: hypothetical protein ENK31_10175 [Nannocystis exedens]|nr:hypothetical protein [Nannocystis exedens]
MSDSARRQVVDPVWEDELRAGQEQDGGAGSVDEELAVLHLLRHLREPEVLGEADLEGIWRSMEPVLKPKPWWQRAWFFVGAPALAGGAALLLVLGTPTQNSGPADAAAGDPKIAVADGARPTLQREAPASVPLAAKPTGSVAESSPGPGSGSGSGLGSASVSASALVLEQHFSLLERGARRELAGRIDLGRARARGDLLARAQGTRS